MANSNLGLEPKLVAISLVLAAGVFVLDILQPLGVAAGIPYVAVVLVGLWSRVHAFVYILAGLASVLTVWGFFASTGDVGSWIVLENRGLALFAIWAVTLAGSRRVSEIERADRALRDNEWRLQDAQRIAQLGSWDWDVATNTGHWSNQLYRIFGMTPQETEADFDLFMGLVHPGDRDLVAKAVEDALSGERPYRLDHRLVRRDGNVRFIKETAEVRRDGNGTPISMHGTVQDITELKEAEQALRESERRLQRAHRISKLSHWEFDLGSRRFKAYGDMYADFGLGDAETEFSFEEALAPVHRDDVARVRAAFERSFAEGVPFDETDRVVYDDGRTGHMRLIGEVIRDNSGAVVRMRGTTQDVTEQMQAQESLKRQEAQLRESEQRLQEAHRIASLTHWEFDVSANRFSAYGEVIDDLEPSAESGKYTAKEASSLILPEDAQRVGRAFERTRRDGTPYNVTYRVRDTDGAIMHLHSLGEAVRDEAGSVVSIRGTSQDVTATVEAEAKLRDSQRRLLDAQRIANLGNWVFDVATGQYSVLGEFFEQYDFPMDDEQAAFSLEAGLAVVHPDDLNIFKSCLDRCLIDGTTFDVTVRSLTADGQSFHLHVIGEAVHDEAGSVVEIRGTTQDVTTQKTVEEGFRTSQRRLLDAQRIANLGNWVFETSTHRFSVFGDFYEQYDFPMEGEVATFSLEEGLEAVHPDDVPAYKESLEGCLKDGTTFDVTVRSLTAEEQTIYLHVLGEAVRDDAGSIVELRGTTQNVTPQKTVEEELRKSQDRLNTAQEMARIGNWDLEAATDKLFFSEGMYRIFDLDPEVDEPPWGEAFYDMVHPDDRDELRKSSDLLLTQGVAENTHYRLITKLGNEKCIVSYRSARFDEQGNLLSTTGTLQDITALREAEELNTRLGRVVEESLNEIYMFEGETLRFIQVNRGARENLGYSMEELEQLTPLDIKPEFDAQQFSEMMAPLRDKSQESLTLETIHRRKDGSDYPVEVHLQLSTAEMPSVFVAIIQDITERRESEKQLVQAQKMETVGQLSAGVAHDFNNMLSVIMGNLELAQRRIAGDPQVESLLESAMKAGQRGADLTQSLLAFSRKQVLFPKSVDVNKAAEGVLALAKRTVAKTVDIEFEPLADLWAAEVDPAHLESAVLNLVVNACAAMPNGGELKISTWNVSQLDPVHQDDESWPTADYVCLAVTDTGHGMAPEVLERAVEPFFTTKGMAQGSGLGLSMVYGFTEQSGGLFDIVSEPGVGTKITLSLPRADGIPAHRDQQKSTGQRDGNARTVLLVEDEPRVMETVAFQLSDLGFRVLVAADAEEALRLLGQKTGVDLLFADVVLGPGKNGIDLALEARQRYPGIRVLCTSGYASDELLARYEGARDLHILAKPFTLDKLSATLDEVLRIDA